MSKVCDDLPVPNQEGRALVVLVNILTDTRFRDNWTVRRFDFIMEKCYSQNAQLKSTKSPFFAEYIDSM